MTFVSDSGDRDDCDMSAQNEQSLQSSIVQFFKPLLNDYAFRCARSLGRSSCGLFSNVTKSQRKSFLLICGKQILSFCHLNNVCVTA
jgi:hypothetical protein